MSGLPEAFTSVASMDEAHRLQLRGQLRNCGTTLGLAHRIPSWLRTTDPQNRDADVMRSASRRVKGKASHRDGADCACRASGQKQCENHGDDSPGGDTVHRVLRAHSVCHAKKFCRDLLSISRVCRFGPVIHTRWCLTVCPERYQMWASRFYKAARPSSEDGKPVNCTPMQ